MEEEEAAGAASGLEGGGASQAIGFLNRLRGAVDAFNNAQDVIGIVTDLNDMFGESDGDELFGDGLQALGAVFSASLKGSRSMAKLGQDHHIATDKSIKTGWTELFKAVFDRCDVGMQDPANIVENLEGHSGRHSKKYHQLVWAAIKDAKSGKGLKGSLKNLRKAIKDNPKILKGDGL